MCNLYSLILGQAAIRAFTQAMRDTTGNMPVLPGIFPDMMAPVVYVTRDGDRELAMMRWGFPSRESGIDAEVCRDDLDELRIGRLAQNSHTFHHSRSSARCDP